MGKEARLFEYHAAHVDKVVGHGWVSKLLKVSPGHPVYVFRPLTEAEEGFLASRFPTGLGHGEHLVGCHGLGVGVLGAFDEGAVTAAVSAQIGQGDENLAGVGDAPPLSLFRWSGWRMREVRESLRPRLGPAGMPLLSIAACRSRTCCRQRSIWISVET